MKTPAYVDELISLSGFNPDQPRDPKGSPTGGQFASTGSGTSDEPVSVGASWNGGDGTPEVRHAIPQPKLDQAIKARDAARAKMDSFKRGSKQWGAAEEDYQFWVGKVAMLEAMSKAGIA